MILLTIYLFGGPIPLFLNLLGLKEMDPSFDRNKNNQ